MCCLFYSFSVGFGIVQFIKEIALCLEFPEVPIMYVQPIFVAIIKEERMLYSISSLQYFLSWEVTI